MHKRNILTPVLAGLALLVLLSCVMVSGRLVTVDPAVPSTTISVKVPQSARLSAPRLVMLRHGITLADSSIHDNKQTWDTDTQVDIFSAVYDNASGEITVESPYGDKLIAPGTANDYDFYIENTGNVTLNYSLTAEGTAIVIKDGTQYEIPIQAKLMNGTADAYLLGGAEQWAGLEGLDNVNDEGAIASGNVMKYTLRWQWPFEQGSDEYDTLLGNLAAAGDELSVRVKLMVTVSAADDPAGHGGEKPPLTRDDFNMALWMTLGILAFAGFLVVLGKARKSFGNEE